MSMIVPSIDILEGKAVRLRQGRKESAEALGEPVALARKYAGAGFGVLHVVDLDAAFGAKSQLAMLEKIADAARGSGMIVQWAGGIRDFEAAEKAFAAGAGRVVFGTAIFSARGEVKRCAGEFGDGAVWGSLDFSGNPPVAKVRGWTQSAGVGLEEALRTAEGCALGGLVISSINADGMMMGPDLALLSEAAAKTKLQLVLAGGMRNSGDAKKAFDAGAAGAIFGRALYCEGIDLEELACLRKE